MKNLSELLEYKNLLDQHKKEVRESIISHDVLQMNVLKDVEHWIEGGGINDITKHTIRFNLNGEMIKISKDILNAEINKYGYTDENMTKALAMKSFLNKLGDDLISKL